MSLQSTEQAAMLAGLPYIVLAPQLPDLGNQLREAAGYGYQIVSTVLGPNELVLVILKK
jgi:hypothetical protein